MHRLRALLPTLYQKAATKEGGSKEGPVASHPILRYSHSLSLDTSQHSKLRPTSIHNRQASPPRIYQVFHPLPANGRHVHEATLARNAPTIVLVGPVPGTATAGPPVCYIYWPPYAINLQPNPSPEKLDPDPPDRLDLMQDIWIFHFNTSFWIQSATSEAHTGITVMMTLHNYHKFLQKHMFKAPTTESTRPTLLALRPMNPPRTPTPKQDAQ